MAKKEKKVPTYNVTYDDIQGYIRKGYRKGREESLLEATKFSLAVPLMVLRDEFGFGEKRLSKFVDGCWELYDSIDKEYLDIQDILKVLKEEVNLEIIDK